MDRKKDVIYMAYINFTETKFDELKTLDKHLQHFMNSTKHVSKWSNPTTILYAVNWLKFILEKDLVDEQCQQNHNEEKKTFDQIEMTAPTINEVIDYFSKFVCYADDIENINKLKATENRTIESYQKLLRDRVTMLKYKTKQCLGEDDLDKTINLETTFATNVMGKINWPWGVEMSSDSNITYELITDSDVEKKLAKDYYVNKKTIDKIKKYTHSTYKEDDGGINLCDLRDIEGNRKVTKKDNWFIHGLKKCAKWATKKFGRTKSRKDNWIMKGR